MFCLSSLVTLEGVACPPPPQGGGAGHSEYCWYPCASQKTLKKGIFWPKASTTSLRKRVVFQSNLRRFWEIGLLLSCPTPFRGRFWHQGLRHLIYHLGSNFEVLGRAWVPLQSASDPSPPPPPPPPGGHPPHVRVSRTEDNLHFLGHNLSLFKLY